MHNGRTTDRHEIYPDPDWDDRVAAARALRDLGNALVRHRPDASLLGAIAEWAQDRTADVVQAPSASRPDDYMTRRLHDIAPPDGSELVAFSDRPLSGPANPLAIDVDMRAIDGGVTATIVWGPAWESAPGRVHGGAISAMVDDVMGYLMVVLGVAAYTANLDVSYRRGVPIEEPVEFRAVERERQGRKLWVELRGTHGGDLLVEATGLFLLVPEERLPPLTSEPITGP